MPDTLDIYAGKRILVMGLGVHGGGLGVARSMARAGANVRVTDLRDADKLGASIQNLEREGLPVEFTLGEHREEDFRWADLIVRNPAVPRESRWLGLARELGKPVEMEISIFIKLCPGPVIGITGTKGKSTTTTWAWEMIRRWRPGAILAGNLRVSALEALPLITEDTPVVLELSSFQLEGLEEPQVSPHIACVTNLSPDHLDRYPNMAEYGAAKKNIFTHQHAERGDYVVLNSDDPTVAAWAAEAPASVAWFGGGDVLAPGVFLQGDTLVWHPRGEVAIELVSAREITLPGRHNLINAACAATVALLSGAPVAAVCAGLREFRGVADRMEYVASLGGVRFVNDTTATAPAAAIAALQSIGGPVVLIAGGAKKNLDFAELAPVAAAQTQAVILLEGTATDLMEQQFRDAGVNIRGRFPVFEDAVRAALDACPAGGTVLLSPGTASFGMFLNEFDRGEQFRRIVQRLVENSSAQPPQV